MAKKKEVNLEVITIGKTDIFHCPKTNKKCFLQHYWTVLLK